MRAAFRRHSSRAGRQRSRPERRRTNSVTSSISCRRSWNSPEPTTLLNEPIKPCRNSKAKACCQFSKATRDPATHRSIGTCTATERFDKAPGNSCGASRRSVGNCTTCKTTEPKQRRRDPAQRHRQPSENRLERVGRRNRRPVDRRRALTPRASRKRTLLTGCGKNPLTRRSRSLRPSRRIACLPIRRRP